MQSPSPCQVGTSCARVMDYITVDHDTQAARLVPGRWYRIALYDYFGMRTQQVIFKCCNGSAMQTPAVPFRRTRHVLYHGLTTFGGGLRFAFSDATPYPGAGVVPVTTAHVFATMDSLTVWAAPGEPVAHSHQRWAFFLNHYDFKVVEDVTLAVRVRRAAITWLKMWHAVQRRRAVAAALALGKWLPRELAGRIAMSGAPLKHAEHRARREVPKVSSQTDGMFAPGVGDP